MRPDVDLLVIGLGNDGRGDDAVGPALARAVEGLPGVRALAVRHLTPELAAEVARACRVVFADAGLEVGAALLLPLEPDVRPAVLGHAGGPSWLLGLAAKLYDRRPEAWLLALPAVDFEFGAGLSPQARRGLALGVERLVAFQSGTGFCPPTPNPPA
jgi:hydrogenase maturation protease